MDEWTKPPALPSTSTLRGCFGLAGALSGSAAIIAVTSSGSRRLILRLRRRASASARRWRPAAGIAAFTPMKSCSCVSAFVFAVSHSVYHLSSVALSSSRVRLPSLFASSAVKSPSATRAAASATRPCGACAFPTIVPAITTAAHAATSESELLIS